MIYPARPTRAEGRFNFAESNETGWRARASIYAHDRKINELITFRRINI